MIIVNQALHGYANGHQMLAASHEWNISDRNKLGVLSDLNGRCDEGEIRDYYTGYVLGDGTQYVIAKTWYAKEMQRPGCVWTHSLIFNIEDIAKIKDVEDVLNIFQRPSEDDYEPYSQKISLEEGKKFNCNTNKCNQRLLEYFLYTIYGSCKPRLVYFEGDNIESSKELLTCLSFMPKQLISSFSFCTLSYQIIEYNNVKISYQITTKDLIQQMKRRGLDMEICKTYQQISEAPFWVKNLYQYISEKRVSEIYRFISLYSDSLCDWETFNGFVALYFLLINRENTKLEEFLNWIAHVMNEYGKKVLEETIYLAVTDSFFADKFDNVEYQILGMIDMGIFKLYKKIKNSLKAKILLGEIENLFPFLCKYIEGELKPKTKVFVEELILQLRPQDLKRVSNMNENICVVLIHLNHRLLISEDIWKENREFQINLLYAGGQLENVWDLKSLLQTIIITDNHNVANECYNIFGDGILELLYDIFRENNNINLESARNWVPVLTKEPLDLLNQLLNIKSKEICRMLFIEVNKNDRLLVEKVDLAVWVKLFDRLVIGETDSEWIRKVCLEYMVIIFVSSYNFQVELVDRVVRPIYEATSTNSLAAEEWNYFQYLLPQVEPCYFWDKCLRLKEALNTRGYEISGINK